MKIAFLSFYSGWIDRGVEVATAELAKRLSKTHEVTVFQGGDRIAPEVNIVRLSVNQKWPQDSSSYPLRTFYLDYYSRQIAKFTLKFIPYFKKNKYDIVIPTNGGWQALLVRLLAKQLDAKIILQGNAGIGRDDLFQAVLKPDCFIAISPNGYEWVRKFSWVKSVYIPYGVDLELFSKTKPAQISLTKPIVLCVAAFSQYKRIDKLIQAMEKVPEASLLVIGQGPMEQELRDLGIKILNNRFRLLNNINHDQLIGYYKTSGLFSLPSESTEALGIVYIEAMAAGLPVVAPDDFNRRQIIGDAGMFVDPEDPDLYAKAISDALKTDFGDKPIKQAEKYSWDKITDEYINLFDSLK